MKKRKYLKLRGEDTMITIIVVSIINSYNSRNNYYQ